MRLETLHLLNFKNYADVNVKFSSRINVLVGKNGSGKTNLLDAIYYLSCTKSAFSPDQMLIRHDQPYFVIRGEFRQGEALNAVSCTVQGSVKKIFREGNQDYQRLSEHIGKYPVILMAPHDTDLINDGGEARRRFFDGILSQLDSIYLENLLRYNNTLKQRNSLLKLLAERGASDTLAIDSYDQALIRYGQPIFEKRKSFITEFLPEFRKFYQYIVGESETTSLEYDTALNTQDFASGLVLGRQRDLMLQRTGFGIHRDDFVFQLGSRDIRKLGSQGQQKSFVVSLKLAQYEILKKYKGYKPILLLDDIFDKLDDFRIERLMALIRDDLDQLFITDARPDRTRQLLGEMKIESSMFTIVEGKIEEQ